MEMFFEKGGVNTSVVFGEVTDAMRTTLKINGTHWWACGLSLVLHPVNPFVPTVHCNYRMFEVYKASLNPSGGGTSQPHSGQLFGETAINTDMSKSEGCGRVTPLTGGAGGGRD